MIPYQLVILNAKKSQFIFPLVKEVTEDICRITGISAGKWSLGELVRFLIILPVDNTVGRPSAIEIWTPLE